MSVPLPVFREEKDEFDKRAQAEDNRECDHCYSCTCWQVCAYNQVRASATVRLTWRSLQRGQTML